MVADSPEAARLLAQAGDDLAPALERRDVNLLSLDVSTSGDQRRAGARRRCRGGTATDAPAAPRRAAPGDRAEGDAEPAPTATVIELPAACSSTSSPDPDPPTPMTVIPPPTGTPRPAPRPRPATNAELGKDDFLKLFVAQLQHQDPMNPMDDQDIMGQMASFSTLEQVTNMARQPEDRQNLPSSSAVGLIGRTVTWTGHGRRLPHRHRREGHGHRRQAVPDRRPAPTESIPQPSRRSLRRQKELMPQ